MERRMNVYTCLNWRAYSTVLLARQAMIDADYCLDRLE
jgi:hypothetical protein